MPCGRKIAALSLHVHNCHSPPGSPGMGGMKLSASCIGLRHPCPATRPWIGCCACAPGIVDVDAVENFADFKLTPSPCLESLPLVRNLGT